MKPGRTLYDVLEVSQSASPVVVKAAYRSLAQALHPDKNSGTASSGQRLAEVNDAYSIVSDPVKRLRYDQALGLHAAKPERRRVVPAGTAGVATFSTGNNLSRPFGFRPFD